MPLSKVLNSEIFWPLLYEKSISRDLLLFFLIYCVFGCNSPDVFWGQASLAWEQGVLLTFIAVVILSGNLKFKQTKNFQKSKKVFINFNIQQNYFKYHWGYLRQLKWKKRPSLLNPKILINSFYTNCLFITKIKSIIICMIEMWGLQCLKLCVI